MSKKTKARWDASQAANANIINFSLVLKYKTVRERTLVSWRPDYRESSLLAVPPRHPLPESLPQWWRRPPSRTNQPITFQSIFLPVIVVASSSPHARTGSAFRIPVWFLVWFELSLSEILRFDTEKSMGGAKVWLPVWYELRWPTECAGMVLVACWMAAAAEGWAGGVLTSVVFPTDETAEQHNDAKKPRTEKGEGGLLVLVLNRVLLISLWWCCLDLQMKARCPSPSTNPPMRSCRCRSPRQTQLWLRSYWPKVCRPWRPCWPTYRW